MSSRTPSTVSTHSVELDPRLSGYGETVFAWSLMQELTQGALDEADEIIEIEIEF